jgi:Transmembrane domain of unknown function (DUF3566)
MEDGVDHRVEPPSWLPQGAAPQAADPEADEAPASSDDAHAVKDDSAPADSPAEEFSNGNGHDGSYSFTHDDSYTYAQDGSFSGRGPFEEATKPPFDELPGAAFNQPAAPPPPGDDLADGGFGDSSAVTVDRPDPGFGDVPAHGTPDGGFPDDGFTGSGFTGSDGSGGFTGSGSGFAGSSGGGGFTGSSYTGHPAAAPVPDGGFGSDVAEADNDPAGGDPYAGASYTAAFPQTVMPTVAVGQDTVRHETVGQDAPPTGAYSYGPPTPASPPPPQSRRQSTQPRRANLIVARLEPWSVMKFSFLISLVAWIVLFVAVALLYYALSSLGVFASLQKTLASVTSSQGSAGVDLSKWTSGTRILGYTMLLGAVDVVLITALSTLGAVVYNLVTHLGGGIEITLKETE